MSLQRACLDGGDKYGTYSMNQLRSICAISARCAVQSKESGSRCDQVKIDTHWICACFVNWCLKEANEDWSSRLNARSFLKYGTSTTKPKIGDIVVFWRISPTSAYGHVGFFVKEEGGLIYCLGGNQSNSVNIATFPKAQVLGYRSIGKKVIPLV